MQNVFFCGHPLVVTVLYELYCATLHHRKLTRPGTETGWYDTIWAVLASTALYDLSYLTGWYSIIWAVLVGSVKFVNLFSLVKDKA